MTSFGEWFNVGYFYLTRVRLKCWFNTETVADRGRRKLVERRRGTVKRLD